MDIPHVYKTAIGIAAGAITAASMLPQLIKLLREKSSEDISIMMLLVLMGGLSLWVVYGIMVRDIAILLSNGISLLINVLVTTFSLAYRNRSNK